MENNEKKVLCSAGISHMLLYPNGDVYRCMADYNAKRAPLFNAKEGWKKFDAPFECTHDKCYAGCDIDWATKWIFEAGKTVPVKIKSQSYHVNLREGSYWSEQTLEKPLKDMVHIVWAPSLICNYDCRYCGCAVGKRNIYKDFPSAFPELSVEEWIQIWDIICAQYDFGILTMSGGEPLLAKATIPVIRRIEDKFAVGIATNLSTNIFELAREIPRTKHGRTGLKSVVASLHLTAKGFNREMFLAAVLYLKKNGLPVTINFVGHPLQLFLAEEYKKWCEKNGVLFVLSPWCGCDNDGFEADYTQAELHFFNKLAPPQRNTQTQVEFHSLRYVLSVDSASVSVPVGEKIMVKGRVKNTGDRSWSNKERDKSNAFKIGARLFAEENEKKSLREGRCALAKEEIASQEECEFEVYVDTCGLAKGHYILKVDMLQEGCFWFQAKGNSPAVFNAEIGLADFPDLPQPHAEILKVDIPEKCFCNTLVPVRLIIKNTGTMEWFSPKSEENIRVGCRIFKECFKPDDIAIRDLRAYPVTAVKPGGVLETEIILDFNGLAAGQYVLVFDMVNEKKYWFCERGSLPFIKRVTAFYKDDYVTMKQATVTDRNGKEFAITVPVSPCDRERTPVVTYYPKVIQLPITDVCNLRCVFCGPRQPEYASGKAIARREMGEWIIDKLGDDVLRNADLYLTGGGEPFLSPMFWQFIDGIRPSRAVYFNTNGVLLNEHNIERLIRYPGRLNLGISLNACTRETYVRLMRSDYFDTVMANVKRLTSRIAEVGRDTAVNATMIVMKENLEEILLLPQIAQQMGAIRITAHVGEFEQDYTLDWFSVREQSLRNNPNLMQRFEQNILELEKQCQERGILPWSRDASDDIWCGICNDVFDYLGVRVNGDTFSCCKGATVSTGNLKDHATFFDLWNNEKRRQMRTVLITGNFPEECRQPICPYWRVAQKTGGVNPRPFASVFENLRVTCAVTDEGLLVKEKGSFEISGIIKNAGNRAWDNAGISEQTAYKVGARLVYRRNENETAGQSRAVFSVQRINIGETYTFSISVNLVGLEAGEYLLKLDLVKENSFWGEEKGNAPLRVPLVYEP